jgi:hypothetical protein
MKRCFEERCCQHTTRVAVIVATRLPGLPGLTAREAESFKREVSRTERKERKEGRSGNKSWDLGADAPSPLCGWCCEASLLPP